MAKRETILIVDDERLNINVLKDLLSSHYHIMVAQNGQQALTRALSSNMPDLILLDIMMPEMDGYEVCRRLKANKASKEIPIIFITAMSNLADEIQGFALGAVDYITKPISPPIVLARIKTHLALKQSLELQKELNRVKNRFLGMAAHDLRNPLTSINGMSQLMLKMSLPEEKKHKFIETIHRVGIQMLNLVNDLLDVSVIESGRFDLRLTTGNLSRLVLERLDLVADLATNKGIELKLELADVRDGVFDYDRIGQVIDNLLTNAIKFSETATTIIIKTHQNDSMVAVAVIDQGQGIPPAEQEAIFGSFNKSSVLPTKGEKSTGLGLSIVKKIVEAHDGAITVESTAGKGSTFTVSLPR